MREPWIDFGKSLGILLVVVGHNPYVWLQHPEVYKIILSFHVPLFFSLSGATLNPEESLKSVFGRAASLIWVYVACALLSLPLVAGRGDAANASLFDLLLGILYGTGHTMHPGPLWFLPALALCLIFTWAVLQCFRLYLVGRSARRFACIAVFGLLVATLGTFAVSQFGFLITDSFGWGSCRSSGCFWSFDLVLVGSGFVIFGYALKAIFAANSDLASFRALFVIGVTFASSYLYFSPSVDIDSRRMIPLGGAVVVAALGVAFVFSLLKTIPVKNRIFLAIGSATLPVLASHQFIQKKVLIILSGDFNGAGFFEFVISVFCAVFVATVFNVLIAKKRVVGQIVFYPREFCFWRRFFNKGCVR
ncbi:acyltransferase family protein [Uliginosibacterium sp. TH139]|uniref:acyltransferase family protein n=1 Tax=Uliginosibacterium sp. TH139 TaxID=2067453 RepID=UPI000C7CA40F|nr:acyltransferase family protein [Uliginosibacterium sp. TH139]PLK50059.1 hypothetical protein C0V76_06540 [Uliginosibacterium sp. TH139]